CRPAAHCSAVFGVLIRRDADQQQHHSWNRIRGRHLRAERVGAARRLRTRGDSTRRIPEAVARTDRGNDLFRSPERTDPHHGRHAVEGRAPSAINPIPGPTIIPGMKRFAPTIALLTIATFAAALRAQSTAKPAAAPSRKPFTVV